MLELSFVVGFVPSLGWVVALNAACVAGRADKFLPFDIDDWPRSNGAEAAENT